MSRKPLKTYGGKRQAMLKPANEFRELNPIPVPAGLFDESTEGQDAKGNKVAGEGHPLDLDIFESTFDRIAKTVMFHPQPESYSILERSSFLMPDCSIKDTPPSPVFKTKTNIRPKRIVKTLKKFGKEEGFVTQQVTITKESLNVDKKKAKAKKAPKRDPVSTKDQRDEQIDRNPTSDSDRSVTVRRTRGKKRPLDDAEMPEAKIRSYEHRKIMTDGSFTGGHEENRIIDSKCKPETSVKETVYATRSKVENHSDSIECLSIGPSEAPQSDTNEIDSSQIAQNTRKIGNVRVAKKKIALRKNRKNTKKLESSTRETRSKVKDRSNAKLIQNTNNEKSSENTEHVQRFDEPERLVENIQPDVNSNIEDSPEKVNYISKRGRRCIVDNSELILDSTNDTSEVKGKKLKPKVEIKHALDNSISRGNLTKIRPVLRTARSKIKICKPKSKKNYNLKSCSIHLSRCDEGTDESCKKTSRIRTLKESKLDATKAQSTSNSHVKCEIKPCSVTLTRLSMSQQKQYLHSRDADSDLSNYEQYDIKPCSVSLTKCEISERNKELQPDLNPWKCSTPVNKLFVHLADEASFTPITMSTVNKDQNQDASATVGPDTLRKRKICYYIDGSSVLSDTRSQGSEMISNSFEFRSANWTKPGRNQDLNDATESNEKAISDSKESLIVSPMYLQNTETCKKELSGSPDQYSNVKATPKQKREKNVKANDPPNSIHPEINVKLNIEPENIQRTSPSPRILSLSSDSNKSDTLFGDTDESKPVESNTSANKSIHKSTESFFIRTSFNFVTTRRPRKQEKKLSKSSDNLDTSLQSFVRGIESKFVNVSEKETDAPAHSTANFIMQTAIDTMQSELEVTANSVQFVTKEDNVESNSVQEISSDLTNQNLRQELNSGEKNSPNVNTFESPTCYDATSDELGNVGSYSEIPSNTNNSYDDEISLSADYVVYSSQEPTPSTTTQECVDQHVDNETSPMFSSDCQLFDICMGNNGENVCVFTSPEEVPDGIQIFNNTSSVQDWVNNASKDEVSESSFCQIISDTLQMLKQSNCGSQSSQEWNTISRSEASNAEDLPTNITHQRNKSGKESTNSASTGFSPISCDVSMEAVSKEPSEVSKGQLSDVPLAERIKLLDSRVNTRRKHNTSSKNIVYTSFEDTSECNESKDNQNLITDGNQTINLVDSLKMLSANTSAVNKESSVENGRHSLNNSNSSRGSIGPSNGFEEKPEAIDSQELLARLKDPVRITRERKHNWRDLKLTAISEDETLPRKLGINGSAELEESSSRLSFLPDSQSYKSASTSRSLKMTLNMSDPEISVNRSPENSIRRQSVFLKPGKMTSNMSDPEISMNRSLEKSIRRQTVFLKPGKQYARSLSLLNLIQSGCNLETHGSRKGKNWRESVQTIMEMQQQGVIQSCVKKNEDDKESRYGAPNHGTSPNRIPGSEGQSSSSASPGRFPRRMSIRVVPDNKNCGFIEDTNFLEAYGISTSKSRKTLSRRSTIIPHRQSLDVYNVQCEDVGIETNETGPAGITARDVVLQRCGQEDYLPFLQCFSETYLECCRKIGEGVYGEVFLFEEGKEKAVVKIIPIEGSLLVNGEPQKKFDEILSEIVIAKELHNLRFDDKYNTCGFAEVKNIRCIIGRYPDKLVDLWEQYNQEKGSDNDCPSMFEEHQLYIALELGHGGQDLEAFVFQTAAQSFALFIQAALALAVAEQSLEFEHRDLHWGNILISNTDDPEIIYKLDDAEIRFASNGVRVAIIDFTLSRMSYEGCCIYNDLALDPALFTAQGEYQFEIYRLMKERIENDWHKFEPYTNILWLHYTLDKMITAVRYRRKSTKVHKAAIAQLQELKKVILGYKSAHEFVTTCEKVTRFQCSDSVTSVQLESDKKEN